MSETTSETDPFADWVTKEAAAVAIGASTKAVERLVQKGQIQAAFRPGPKGGAMLRVYHPDDVARIAQERRAAPLPPFVVPGPTDRPTNGNGGPAEGGLATLPGMTPSHIPGDDVLRVLVTAAMHILSETSETPTLSPEERAAQYVTLPEAAVIKGRTPTFLKRAIKDGRLQAEKDRGWRIRRKDLEAL